MILQTLLLATVGVTAVVAWPISPIGEYRKEQDLPVTVKCGDTIDWDLEYYENLVVTFSSQQEIDHDGPCVIHVRSEVKDTQIEKYGLRVVGELNLQDPASGTTCSSSYLLVSDKDDEEDKNGFSTRYCGEEKVNFTTTEDIVNIELHLVNPGANSASFSLKVKPHYLCGGIIDEERDISTPDFPNAYQKDLVCVWKIQGQMGTNMHLQFSTFNLAPRRKTVCFDSLAVGNDLYCGTELQNTLIKSNKSHLILMFQARKNNKGANPHTGFKARLTFKTTTKRDSLMAKFFM